MENIKEVIRKNRMENKYKQAYMSHVTGMSQSNYSQIESGKVSPTLDDLEKIAGVYGKTVTELTAEAHSMKIEHNNHPESNNRSQNGCFYGVEPKEKIQEQPTEIVEALQETVASQRETIAAQKATITTQQTQIERLLAEVERLK
jgi:transcriptional regulator with XRE-family HTH domain